MNLYLHIHTRNADIIKNRVRRGFKKAHTLRESEEQNKSHTRTLHMSYHTEYAVQLNSKKVKRQKEVAGNEHIQYATPPSKHHHKTSLD
ncbi:hypothetical protein EON63_10465 [archaeon]|nr:MAG: hypothetical protein EON63_10465 [archaeon]